MVYSYAIRYEESYAVYYEHKIQHIFLLGFPVKNNIQIFTRIGFF